MKWDHKIVWACCANSHSCVCDDMKKEQFGLCRDFKSGIPNICSNFPKKENKKSQGDFFPPRISTHWPAGRYKSMCVRALQELGSVSLLALSFEDIFTMSSTRWDSPVKLLSVQRLWQKHFWSCGVIFTVYLKVFEMKTKWEFLFWVIWYLSEKCWWVVILCNPDTEHQVAPWFMLEFKSPGDRCQV